MSAAVGFALPKSVSRRRLCSGRHVAAFLLVALFSGLPVTAAAEPSLGVMVDHRWVDGTGFPAETPLTLSVNGGDKGTTEVTTDGEGNFWVNWLDVSSELLLPGDTFSAFDGQDTVSMVVQDFGGRADRSGDRVSGTAKEPGQAGSPLSGRRVRADVNSSDWSTWLASGEATTDSTGRYSIALTPFDLLLEHEIFMTMWNSDGHRTMREAYNAIPSLRAAEQYNWVDGAGFPSLMAVTIKVNGGAKGTLQTTTLNDGYFWVNWWDAGEQNQLAVGDTITAVVAGVSIEMVIQDLGATVNTVADTVTGTATNSTGSPLANRGLRAFVYDRGDWSELSHIDVLTDAGGGFTADFSSTHDMRPGEIVQVELWDKPDGSMIGHRTMFQPYNGIPTLKVMIGQMVELMDFPPETGVDVSVNSGVKGSETVIINLSGYSSIDWWQRHANRPLPGDSVTAEFGGTTVQMEVHDLQAVSDTEHDRIVGAAFYAGGVPLEGRTVAAWVFPAGDWSQELAEATATVGADGGFTLEFPDFDLQRGMEIDLMLLDFPDDSGASHQTHLQVYNLRPQLAAVLERRLIRGRAFPASTDVTVSVNGGAKGVTTVTTDGGGFFQITWDDLLPGDTVSATFPGYEVQMLVQDIVAAVDFAGNRIAGMALDAATRDPLAGEKIQACLFESWSQQASPDCREAAIATDGVFTFDLNGAWDLKRGDLLLVIYTSPEGHRTSREPTHVDITGTVRRDAADGPGMPGVIVRIEEEANTVTDDDAVSTDEQGRYSITGLSPGVYKLYFDASGYNQQHADTMFQSEWHEDKADFNTGDWVVVTPDGDVQVVDAVLENTGGGIDGTVTGKNGVPLTGIWVCVQHESWTGTEPNCAYLVPTGEGGGYGISGAAPGTYRMLFYAGDYNEGHGTSYASRWHADVVAVTTGSLSHIDASLDEGGFVAGKVTGEEDLPLEDIQVQFLAQGGLWAGGAATDEEGNYSLSLPPGSYKVLFVADDHNENHDADYVRQWFREPGETEVALVEVAPGETTQGIGAHLEIGGRIQGGTASPGVGPLWGVRVKVYPSGDRNTVAEETETDVHGNYIIRGVAPGSYKVFFDPTVHNQTASADYLPEWYHNRPYFNAATTLSVGAGSRVRAAAWLIRPDAARLFMVAPAADEAWAQGSLQTIRWEGRVATGDVKILLYQGMALKATISAKTPNNGWYGWTVPATLAPGSYKIYVVWLSNPAVQASAPFTVGETTGPLTVTPGLPIAQGEVQTIAWNGIPRTGNVSIKLYQGAAIKATVAASTPNDGSFDWTVPATLPPGVAYTVRVTWLSKPTLLGSSAPFTVGETKGTLTVTPELPVAQGEVRTVSWGGVPLTGNVSIKLYQGATVKATVAASTPNDGSFDWTVPATLPPGIAYTVRVTWLSKPTVAGSSAPFTVGETKGPITVTPQLPVAQGEAQRIAWSGIPQSGNVSIKLYQGFVLKATVAASTPNDGSFDWTVPATIAPVLPCTILITWLSKATVVGTSEDFTIDPGDGPLTVTPELPAAQGGVQTISWGGIPATGNVSIKLYQGATVKATVAASTPNDGSFDWAVPATLPSGVEYTVRVTWLSKPTLFGSSAAFTIGETKGPIAVTPQLPVAQGGVRTITWDGIPRTGNVSIKLYQGATFKATVAASTPNDGSFDWTVPATLATTVTYKLQVTWLSKPAVVGWSSEFTVDASSGTILVSQPASGTLVRQGAVQEVTWGGIPPTGNVKILLYQGAVLKGTVAASTPNDGSFDWIVPGAQALGADYRLRVIWLSRPVVLGESAAFSVTGP